MYILYALRTNNKLHDLSTSPKLPTASFNHRHELAKKPLIINQGNFYLDSQNAF